MRSSTGDDRWTVPVLEPRTGSLARVRRGGRHPAAVFAAALVVAFLGLAVAATLLGLLATDVLVGPLGLGTPDEHAVESLAAHRTHLLTELSAVGSTLGGAPLLPHPGGPARSRPRRAAPLAPRGVRRLRARHRVRDLPGRLARWCRGTARTCTGSSRPARGRELAVRPHRRLGRRLRRPGAARDLAHPQRGVRARGLGRRRAGARVRGRLRACTAGCTTRSTSRRRADRDGDHRGARFACRAAGARRRRGPRRRRRPEPGAAAWRWRDERGARRGRPPRRDREAQDFAHTRTFEWLARAGLAPAA